METRKIASACFMGGVAFVCMVLLAPHLWWAALLMGFVAGYLAYEFQEALQTVRYVVGELAGRETRELLGSGIKYIFRGRPLGQLTLLLSVPTAFLLLFFAQGVHGILCSTPHLEQGTVREYRALWCVLFALSCMVNLGFLRHWAYLGMEKTKEFSLEGLLDSERGYRLSRQYPYVRSTYPAFFGWLRAGFPNLRREIGSWLWWGMALPFRIIGGIFRGTFWVLKEIHSEKRMLCGFHSVLGGVVPVLLFGTGDGVGEKIFITLLGGFTGALFGVVFWRVVSIRILGLAASKA